MISLLRAPGWSGLRFAAYLSSAQDSNHVRMFNASNNLEWVAKDQLQHMDPQAARRFFDCAQSMQRRGWF